jgi:hypothetical protein
MKHRPQRHVRIDGVIDKTPSESTVRRMTPSLIAAFRKISPNSHAIADSNMIRPSARPVLGLAAASAVGVASMSLER